MAGENVLPPAVQYTPKDCRHGEVAPREPVIEVRIGFGFQTGRQKWQHGRGEFIPSR